MAAARLVPARVDGVVGLSPAERAHEAILQATYELVAERGLADATVAAIAARARVSKATIYARWASKSEIVVELLGRFADQAVALPDSGSLREDLRIVLRHFVDIADRLRGVTETIVGAVARDPLLAAEFERMIGGWRQLQGGLVRRAVKRGELPADVDVELATDLVAGTVMFRLLLAADSRDVAELPDRMVEPILRAWGAAP